MTLFPDCLIWQLQSELELLVSQEDVNVEKFLERWPQIAKCFVDKEIDQGTYKIMLDLQRTDKF